MFQFLAVFALQALAQESTDTISESAATPELVEEDECAKTTLADYSVNFHVVGLFILLLTTFLGTFGTMLVGNIKSKVRFKVLLVAKMFGIGVIAASAWIHLLPEAFDRFNSPCLKGYWTEYGGAYVGLFALFAAFTVQLIEFSTMDDSKAIPDNHSHETEKEGSADVAHDFDKHELEITLPICDVSQHDHTEESNISIVLLEAGIIFHSIVIGLNLGIEEDGSFTTLLIAIIFHQFFEGMALGALIAASRLSKSTKFILGVMYPITTPIGMAIGIGIRSSINLNSHELVLFQGILGSLSAGILMYNTYSELMSLEVNHNSSFKKQSKLFKAGCFFSMYLGASALAVLAIWA